MSMSGIRDRELMSNVHTLPIEKGGMAIRNMGVVALTPIACSLAASLKHMAIISPEQWIITYFYIRC